MKKKIIYIIVIIIIMGITNLTYYNSKTEKVLVFGKVFGFNVKNYKDSSKNEENLLITATSKKVGTITFVKKSTNEFVALGHSISGQVENKNIQGDCYEIQLDGIQKASKTESGKIIAKLDETSKIGKLKSDSKYGIFGVMDDITYNNFLEIETASRYNISKGEAEVLIDMDGNGIKSYSIQITGINYLHENQNIKIKVTSEELINLAGGIVQGMSGSPIVQKGKLIGAVNFVSSDNPLNARGIFIDKLI